MNTNGMRAAIYLRVSRDDQTTENQRLVLARVAEHRGWTIVQTYEDQGISGAKGRDQRPACQSALNIDPRSASKIDPSARRLVPVVHRGDPRVAECPQRG